MTGSAELQVLPVTGRADRRAFLALPARLYRDDPHWIAPLRIEEGQRVFGRNPLFEHAEARAWLAWRGGRPVGRITAQIDRLQQEVHRDRIGLFGMLEAEDDPEVFAALFAAAEGWLRARGRKRSLGPFSLSINEETGLLIDGFNAPPMIFMPHDPPYAAARIEALGYAKAKDVLAYLYEVGGELPRSARRLLDTRTPETLTVRTLDARRFFEEFDTVTAIFNDAWSGNWGFIPFTRAEISRMAKSLKPLIDPGWVAIAQANAEPVGFGILLPNLNEAISDFGGRLLPFNWIRLLVRLRRGLRTARVPLMGVRRSHSGGLLGGLIAFLIIDRMRQAALLGGVEKIELSWILEDNHAMRRVIESLGASPYKTYRVYEKAL